MKKIGIFLQPAPFYGGSFQYVTAILEAANFLPKDRFEVTVAYINPIWKEYLKPYPFRAVMIPESLPGIKGRVLGKIGRILENLWEKYNLPIPWWRKITHYFRPIAKTLVDQKCDLWVFPSQDVWSYQIKVPALSIIHDLMHRYQSRFPEVSADGIYEFRERLYSNMCQASKGILVDSELGREHVHESYGTPKERIFVLPFIPPRYIYENKVAGDFDTRYKLPEKFIFYPAQFWEHKNHAGLIKAVGLLKSDIPDINLVLVGSQEKNGYKSAKHLAEDLNLGDAIHFMGYVPDEDMPEFYRRARALVMPTFFGPTNIPQLEAFALGCPVASSNVFAMPEQLGDAAILFNPVSVEEIADSIRRLWIDDELCKDLAEKGRGRASKWGQAQFNQRFLEIVEQIV